MLDTNKQEIVNLLFDKDILIDVDFLDNFKSSDIQLINDYLKNNDLDISEDNYMDFFNNILENNNGSFQKEETSCDAVSPVKILFSYDKPSCKKQVQDFVKYFNARYNQIKNILSARDELSNLTSVKMCNEMKEKKTVSIISIIKEKEFTKNNNIILTVEDMTGSTKVLVNNNKEEIFELAKNLVYDEIIGINGNSGNNIIFANSVVQPDIPLTKELKKCNEEVYAIFISDIHFGSKNFLDEKFDKFIKWLNGEAGNDKQKELVKKIKYVFVAGDIVDGIGIYPGQDKDLAVGDIYDQYRGVAEKLKQFPKDVQIIMCPGNHDAMRLSEPQPVFYNDYAEALHEIENLTLVSNPAMVRVHQTDTFAGFDILMYHGSSFDYYLANVDELRLNGGYDRPDLMMKFLLKRRHLAPSYASTPYLIDNEKDNLVIENVPDIFLTGHIHKCAVASYRNVTLIAGSCWQERTAYEIKLGHHPEPGRVPLVNLQTREAKILVF